MDKDKYFSWKELITESMIGGNDSWNNVESCTMTSEEMNKKFYTGFGRIEGTLFTVWTAKYIYFPVVYNGAEWVGRISRNPNGESCWHFGATKAWFISQKYLKYFLQSLFRCV